MESRRRRATARRRAAGAAAPWWAEGGSESCPFCHQLYVYELEIRCLECDRPLCPHCAVIERLSVVCHLCPGCASGAAAAEEGA